MEVWLNGFQGFIDGIESKRSEAGYCFFLSPVSEKRVVRGEHGFLSVYFAFLGNL